MTKTLSLLDPHDIHREGKNASISEWLLLLLTDIEEIFFFILIQY